MSSCSSFWGKLVKNFNKTPALRPRSKELRPGARLSTYNVAPLVKRFKKTQLFSPQTQLISPQNTVSQLLFAPNAAKFLLSQTIDKAEVAAPLIVKNFNKSPGPPLTSQLLSPVQVAAHFAAPLVQVPAPPPFHARSSSQRGPDAAPMNLLNILTELVKCFNLGPRDTLN